MGQRRKRTPTNFIGPIKKDHHETFTKSALVGIIEGYLRKYHLAEVDALIGDYTKAQKELGWVPRTSFKDMVTKMVENDIRYVSRR